MAINSVPRDDRRALHAAGLLLPGLQERRKVGARSTPSCPRPSAPATWSCARKATSPASSTTWRARSTAVIYVDKAGEGAAPVGRASSASPATRSRRRGCCCSRPPTCSRTGWPIRPAQVGRNYMRHMTGSVLRRLQEPGAHVQGHDDGRHRARRGTPRHPARLSPAATSSRRSRSGSRSWPRS